MLEREVEKGVMASYSIKIQAVEIYKEKVNDLLQKEFSTLKKLWGSTLQKSSQNLRIITMDGMKIVQDANEMEASTPKEAFQALKMAKERRVIGSTKMNDQSS